jgi:hypothetical protein
MKLVTGALHHLENEEAHISNGPGGAHISNGPGGPNRSYSWAGNNLRENEFDSMSLIVLVLVLGQCHLPVPSMAGPVSPTTLKPLPVFCLFRCGVCPGLWMCCSHLWDA